MGMGGNDCIFWGFCLGLEEMKKGEEDGDGLKK